MSTTTNKTPTDHLMTNKPATNHVNKSHIEKNTSCNHKNPGSGHFRYIANGNSNEHPKDSSQSRDQIVECGNVPLHASGQEDSIVPYRGIHGTCLQHKRVTHEIIGTLIINIALGMYCTLIGTHNTLLGGHTNIVNVCLPHIQYVTFAMYIRMYVCTTTYVCMYICTVHTHACKYVYGNCGTCTISRSVVHTCQLWYIQGARGTHMAAVVHTYIVLEPLRSYLTRVVFRETEWPGWC